MLEEVMTRYRIRFELQFVTANGNEADFDNLTDRFYEELLNVEEACPEIIDPDTAASLADLTVAVEMLVEADHLIDAQFRGLAAARTALHTIEVATPGWEAVIASITAPSPQELQDA
jgi:hypothetical protein